jgi:hypothetical protein
MTMKKLLSAVAATLFASVAFAQAPVPAATSNAPASAVTAEAKHDAGSGMKVAQAKHHHRRHHHQRHHRHHTARA